VNKNKGSITIFLSMILLVVVSIVFATTELGRIEVGHTMASRVTYMAEDSCFSQYVKEIYEDYGIMCLWMNEEELQKEYSSYVKKILNTKMHLPYRRRI
jgi:actin-like ATPase involved in cell morphogenesis